MENREYFGYKLTQREDKDTIPFFIFYAQAKDIVQWVGVQRTHEQPKGTQRILRNARKRAITRFLKSDSKNTIPNNILVAFNPDVAKFLSLKQSIDDCLPDINISNNCGDRVEWGCIRFSFDQAYAQNEPPALLVDGQHRLYGMYEFEEEDIPLLVVCLLDAPVEEQAFQFIVVNKKAVRVQTDDIKSIIADVDEKKLTQRLSDASIRYGDEAMLLKDVNNFPLSPFAGLLDWGLNRDGERIIPPAAIEQSVRHIQKIFNHLEEDDDSILELFFAIWNGVRAGYKDLWGKDNKLMKKVSINALNEFLCDNLRTDWRRGRVDLLDSDEVERNILEIIKTIPAEFWTSEWKIDRIQDNANVREMIKNDLGKIADNYVLDDKWYQDLQLISENNIES